MLELNQLTGPVAEMADSLAGRSRSLKDLARQAQQKLDEHAQVTDALLKKLQRAGEVDPSWRGAEPLGARLDAIRALPWPAPQATLLASDGSQIYPDTHAIALYYLLNMGEIVLRQGSGAAPTTRTRASIFYEQNDLYGEEGTGLIDTDEVNFQRDLQEVQAIARLAVEEREALGGDLERTLIPLGDGPLLPWMPQRLGDAEQSRRVDEYVRELERMKKAQAAPLGYVDRPRSANILRLLILADLKPEEITKERLRRENPYRELSDRKLFEERLRPGQRSALFAATSEINRTYAGKGQRIYFCYLNVARSDRPDDTIVVRVETPQWIALDEERLDAALASVWADCQLTNYPYVLARAHELALVSRHEREAFEQMLRIEMIRRGLPVAESAKANTKRYVGGR